MAYRFESTEISVNHLMGALSDNMKYGGYTCSYRKLDGKYRYGISKFEAVALSTISNREAWQTVAFPCYSDGDGSWVISYQTPIFIWNGTGHCYAWKDEYVNERIEKVKQVCLKCDDIKAEIAYLIAYIER